VIENPNVKSDTEVRIHDIRVCLDESAVRTIAAGIRRSTSSSPESVGSGSDCERSSRSSLMTSSEGASQPEADQHRDAGLEALLPHRIDRDALARPWARMESTHCLRRSRDGSPLMS